MFDVKICDRCRAQFAPHNRLFSLKPVRYIFGIATHRFGFGGRYTSLDKYDLCPECYEELLKFLNGEDTDEVK